MCMWWDHVPRGFVLQSDWLPKILRGNGWQKMYENATRPLSRFSGLGLGTRLPSYMEKVICPISSNFLCFHFLNNTWECCSCWVSYSNNHIPTAWWMTRGGEDAITRWLQLIQDQEVWMQAKRTSLWSDGCNGHARFSTKLNRSSS